MKLCANNCIFIEPSVGDGRILSKLFSSSEQIITTTMTEKQQPQNSHNSSCEGGQGQQLLCCVGYDIDPTAVLMAHYTLEKNMRVSTHGSKIPAVFCQDFLTVTYQKIMDYANNTACNSNSDKKHKQHVVVVGGPPYTFQWRNNDHTCSSSDVRYGRMDLTKKFILHSLLSLRASVVIFILPQRCERQAHEIHQELMMTFQASSSYNSDGISTTATTLGQSLHECSSLNDNSCWSYTTETLPNNIFDFQGKLVKQPSILQVWTHKR
jgi:hypothetical protein